MHLTPSFRRLPPGVYVGEVAASCRDATVAFLDGVRSSWGERELSAWLAGPYRALTSLAPRAGLDHGAGGYGGEEIDEATDTPERLMCDAHDEVLAMLRSFETPDDGVTFAYLTIRHARVTRCGDDAGDLGWAPSSSGRMPLSDRVLSLVAVDYLAHPSDYEKELAICASCESVAFDSASRERGVCSLHVGSSMRVKTCHSYAGEFRARRTAT
jgi:hypothetical protein